MWRTLRICVEGDFIYVQEWKYDEECKYADSFTSWAELLQELESYLPGYAYIYITH